MQIATVAPRPTAVIAQTTTWEDYPHLWPRLLGEVYGVVREQGLEPAGPRWGIYGHAEDLETEIYWLIGGR